MPKRRRHQKAVTVSVLLAKVRAVLKRYSPAMTGGILHAGDIIIDQAGIVVTIGGKPISLKTIEYKRLSFMLKARIKF